MREVNEADIGAVSDRRWEDESPRRVQAWSVQSNDSRTLPKQYTIPASKLLPIMVKSFQWQTSPLVLGHLGKLDLLENFLLLVLASGDPVPAPVCAALPAAATFDAVANRIQLAAPAGAISDALA